jgi:emfourin
MRVHFERSGGFGGMRLTAELDTDQLQVTYGATRIQRALSPEEARHLERLVESSDFFALPARTSSAARGADRFQYVITVENAGQRHSVQTMDEAAPEALSALLASLRNASMGRKIVPNSGVTP